MIAPKPKITFSPAPAETNFSLIIRSFTKAKIEIGKAQIESIKIIDGTTFWLSSEDEGFTKSPRLFKIIF